MQHLANKIVERAQIYAAQRHACVRNINELAPQLFLRRVQTEHDDRMRLDLLSLESVARMVSQVARCQQASEPLQNKSLSFRSRYESLRPASFSDRAKAPASARSLSALLPA